MQNDSYKNEFNVNEISFSYERIDTKTRLALRKRLQVIRKWSILLEDEKLFETGHKKNQKL